MTNSDKYYQVFYKLRNRYREIEGLSKGKVITHINGKPTRYYILDNMALIKYLGCDKSKLGKDVQPYL